MAAPAAAGTLTSPEQAVPLVWLRGHPSQVTMQLPDNLAAALDAQLQAVSLRDLARATRDLSQRLRAYHGTAATLRYSTADAAAYLAYRLPVTFAAVSAVLEEVRVRGPDLRPRTLLDAGAGPGTAMWAAIQTWPELEHIALLERDPEMIRLGKGLAVSAMSPAIRSADWRRLDLTALQEIPRADVVIAGYMLGEIPASAREDLIGRLWDAAGETCILIEPGTPRGFDVIRHAGAQLAGGGAHIVAPFPADWHCLESENDWCHFSQRVPRTRLLRQAKGATLSFEDEKYSYVAASRVPGIPIAARVIRHPQNRSGHIRLVLCTQEGVKRVVITRSNREAYRRAKDLSWGSAIEREEAELFHLELDPR